MLLALPKSHAPTAKLNIEPTPSCAPRQRAKRSFASRKPEPSHMIYRYLVRGVEIARVGRSSPWCAASYICPLGSIGSVSPGAQSGLAFLAAEPTIRALLLSHEFAPTRRQKFIEAAQTFRHVLVARASRKGARAHSAKSAIRGKLVRQTPGDVCKPCTAASSRARPGCGVRAISNSRQSSVSERRRCPPIGAKVGNAPTFYRRIDKAPGYHSPIGGKLKRRLVCSGQWGPYVLHRRKQSIGRRPDATAQARAVND
jgi:hypothetical protein